MGENVDTAAKGSKSGVGKKRRRTTPSFCSYIHKVLKQVHPDLQAQQKTMYAVNSLVENLQERLTDHATTIAKTAKKGTIQACHVEAATKLIMSESLAKHSVSEGTKAVATFSANSGK